MTIFRTLQQEVYDWSLDNFGDQPDYYPFMGTGEAAYEHAITQTPEHGDFFREWTAARGELERSILKIEQGIDDAIKYDDGTRVGHRAEEQALSRMLCELHTFVTNRGYTLEDCINLAWYDEVIDREWDSNFN